MAGGTEHATTFAGSRQEAATAPGVSYFRNRTYDQASGRWLQEDPIGIAGGLNLYQYNGNDPVSFADPFGLCPIPPSSCLGSAGADLGVGFVPVVSTIHDVATVFRGTNLVTGEKVGLGGRLIAAAGALTPASGGQIRALLGSGKAALRALIKDAMGNPGGWRTVGAFTEAASSKAAKGGVSIQRVIQNEAGDQLVEHTVLDKAGKAVDGPHYRPNYKPRDVDQP